MVCRERMGHAMTVCMALGMAGAIPPAQAVAWAKLWRGDGRRKTEDLRLSLRDNLANSRWIVSSPPKAATVLPPLYRNFSSG
jgi:hypothetical protein